MTTNSTLRVSDLSFDSLKSSLKTYLSGQTELVDFDFDSSTMDILLDMLAYNSYQNSFYANMVANEMNIDTARLRDSIVSRAKALGYTPRSAISSSANVQVTITPGDSPSVITLPKNTKFQTTLNNVTYDFVADKAYTISPDGDGVYTANIDIKEGVALTHRYTVDTSANTPYVLPNGNTDIFSLSVTIQESSSNTNTETYLKASDLYEVNSSSKIYFVEERTDGDWEVKFGDGVLGKKPVNGNIINLNYRVCSGPDPNGAAGFTASESIDGYSTSLISVTTNSVASGGALREGRESIRFNAPRNYETQNRAVTANDYKRILQRETGDIDKIVVWGGEENTPPIYGKVYIVAKPIGSYVFSTQRKEEFKNILSKYNVMSIDPEFVDPTFLYVKPTLQVDYDPDLTTESPGAILSLIENTVQSYETTYLSNFDKSFFFSKFLAAIDSSEKSILGTSGKVEVQKRFVPVFSGPSTYTINFNMKIKHPGVGHVAHPGNHYLTSSSFTYKGVSGCKFDDDGEGVLRIFYVGSTGFRTYISENIGTIDYDNGLVTINQFVPDSLDNLASEISITVEPQDFDIKPVRNQILLMTGTKVNLNDKNNGILKGTLNASTNGDTLSINSSLLTTPTIY